jgi:rod shape determining protein RodA
MLVITVLALSCLGILVIGSAKESVQSKQILGLILGMIAMVVLSMLDYMWILRFSWGIYILNLLILVAVPLFGDDAGGAQRWIDLGFVRFQPSELSKILLILFFTNFIVRHEEEIKVANPKVIIKALILLAIPAALIYKQPDMSTTICILMVFCALMFLGGLSYRFIGIVLAITIPCLLIFMTIVVQPNQKLISEYQQTRILAWLQPEKYSTSGAYQQTNSIMAIGSGQLSGKGLNNNTTASVKNGNYLSEPQTDFIFAIVGEELGFVGCCFVIILLLLIIVQLILIGARAQNLSGRIICCGLAALIGFQSFINISVATGLFPNTGIPLPFVSYGLTSLLSLYIGIGVALNVGLQPKKY